MSWLKPLFKEKNKYQVKGQNAQPVIFKIHESKQKLGKSSRIANGISIWIISTIMLIS